MKTHIIILVLSFFCSNFTQANEYWKKDYAKIDAYAKTVKPTADINQLTLKLTEKYATDLEKYRSIFTWIAHNIAYDYNALKNPSQAVVEPVKVLRSKKTICEGYTGLFRKMCELANLECTTIIGWSHIKENIGKNLGNIPNHAWNAIKLKNKWYLCDVTWGAGSIYEGTTGFTFEFNDAYFCTPPELFSFNHFPEQKEWLLGVELSKEKFSNRPHFYPLTVKMNTRNLAPENGTLTYKKGDVIKFKFNADIDVKQILANPSGANKSPIINFTQQNSEVKFDYTFDTYKPYLYIYINNQSVLFYKVKKT